MASTSSAATGPAGRIRTAAATISSDNESLIADTRRAVNMLKEVAVDLERENQSQMVKELEDAVVELVQAYADSMQFSESIKLVADKYQPGPELTDFGKLIDAEKANLKRDLVFDVRDNILVRQFREAVWNVHHAGQPMPGEEQEDLVMTSTQCSLLNVKCPLSGKPVTELDEPVRSVVCKHIYEKKAIMHYLRSKTNQRFIKCPVAACPNQSLDAQKVLCDPLLLVEIEEMRSMSRQTTRADVIEDCTGADEDGA